MILTIKTIKSVIDKCSYFVYSAMAALVTIFIAQNFFLSETNCQENKKNSDEEKNKINQKDINNTEVVGQVSETVDQHNLQDGNLVTIKTCPQQTVVIPEGLGHFWMVASIHDQTYNPILGQNISYEEIPAGQNLSEQLDYNYGDNYENNNSNIWSGYEIS